MWDHTPHFSVPPFPMTLSREEVEYIADLARLKLTEAQKARYREQLSTILDHFERLQELDTSEIRPTSGVLPARTVLREDEPGECLSRETLFQNAPDVDEDQFRVPPMLA